MSKCCHISLHIVCPPFAGIQILCDIYKSIELIIMHQECFRRLRRASGINQSRQKSINQSRTKIIWRWIRSKSNDLSSPKPFAGKSLLVDLCYFYCQSSETCSESFKFNLDASADWIPFWLFILSWRMRQVCCLELDERSCQLNCIMSMEQKSGRDGPFLKVKSI